MNVVELKPYDDIYNKFLDFFDIMPCVMFYPPKIIFEQEYNVYVGHTKQVLGLEVMRVSSPFFKNKKLMLRNVLNETWNEIGAAVETMINDLPEVSKSWMNQRLYSDVKARLDKNYDVTSMAYYLSKEKEAVMRDLLNWGISYEGDIDMTKFPGARLMEYAQYKKVHGTKKEITKNDAMDVTISCIVPYVDAVITEASMAEIFRQSRGHIPQMRNVEIYTLRDIRTIE